ncbi:MAG TPA: hypothetical protein VFX50_10630, partial [Gemmatimonadales bacterium]|nr:hypothetical protein [Gemmatimonadales bacterium]
GGHAYGGARHDGHRNWSGHRGHWHGRGYWGAGWGLYFGLPLVYGAAWGWPYYYGYGYDYAYPRETVIYREVEREPLPYPEGVLQPMPSTEVAPGPGAPTRGPLYMNYCESARAYFPKVTKCPEGWRLATPAS